MAPTLHYLQEDSLPVDEKDGKRIVAESRQYDIVDGTMRTVLSQAVGALYPDNYAQISYKGPIPVVLQHTLLSRKSMTAYKGMRTDVRRRC